MVFVNLRENTLACCRVFVGSGKLDLGITLIVAFIMTVRTADDRETVPHGIDDGARILRFGVVGISFDEDVVPIRFQRLRNLFEIIRVQGIDAVHGRIKVRNAYLHRMLPTKRDDFQDAETGRCVEGIALVAFGGDMLLKKVDGLIQRLSVDQKFRSFFRSDLHSGEDALCNFRGELGVGLRDLPETF